MIEGSSAGGTDDLAALPDPLLVRAPEVPPVATVALPGSKSITNRALIAAALADGTSSVSRALRADDTFAMVACLRALGVVIDEPGSSSYPEFVVHGRRGHPWPAHTHLDARLSGTTARFLLPVLALAPARSTARLDGAPPLRDRPMADGIAAARALGAEVHEGAVPGHLPVTVTSATEPRGSVKVRADSSSQFLSGLLLAGPTQAAGLTIEVDGPLVSHPYVELTRQVMAAFGATTRWRDAATVEVGPGGYEAARYVVEPDASAASYVLAAGALVPGSRLRLEGIGDPPLQGDWGFAQVLADMGADVRWGSGFLEVRGGAPLRGVTVDLNQLSDTAQTLAVVAAFAEGPTEITGIGFTRHKETDRVANVVAELNRCGVVAHEREDGYVIEPGSPRSAVVQTYDDHRMAMSFALLGLRGDGIAIADPACVAKTFPGYWSMLASLGVTYGTTGDR